MYRSEKLDFWEELLRRSLFWPFFIGIDTSQSGSGLQVLHTVAHWNSFRIKNGIATVDVADAKRSGGS
jgi:hypothetical protein